MRYLPVITALIALAAGSASQARQPRKSSPPHNIVLVVIDGLRGKIVSGETAPALTRLRDAGAYFPNSHSVFPTFTTANASALATGHQLGDTGDFSNTIWTAVPIASAAGSVTPFLENDAVLGEVDSRFGGNYLNEMTVLEAARNAGYGTAAIGKLGPALIQDHRARDGMTTIIVDDSTGRAGGIPLPQDAVVRMNRAGLPLTAPSRGANGRSGDAQTAGTLDANLAQQDYFIDVATRVALPAFKARHQPFAMVFWSRDPDGTQHNQGDSLNRLTPGINGPTTFAAIRNADGDLAKLRIALKRLGLEKTTDIIVTSDHGFSTISKESRSSPAAHGHYTDVPEGFLPPGFVAIDLASALAMQVFDPEAGNVAVAAGMHPSRGNALLGTDPARPDVVVAANGGSDLLYLPGGDPALARRVVAALLDQDYVSGIFVDDRLGSIAGTLPLSAINLKGSSLPPTPSIVVNLRTASTGCAVPTNCQIEVADTTLQQGQGMHGSFGRGDTLNFTAAIGPDFKRGFIDPAPVSNVDIGRTMMSLLRLSPSSHGTLMGRIIKEAMPGQPPLPYKHLEQRSEPGANGLVTVLRYQEAAGIRYLDDGGFPGRTLGLDDTAAATHAR